jgi:hypothetical protein
MLRCGSLGPSFSSLCASYIPPDAQATHYVMQSIPTCCAASISSSWSIRELWVERLVVVRTDSLTSELYALLKVAPMPPEVVAALREGSIQEDGVQVDCNV